MIVRSHRPSDIEALYRIDQECFPPGISYSREELAGYVRHPASKTWVAEEDGNIVGFLVAGREARKAGHIITIDVLQSRRRQGIGKLLMAVVEGWARRAGLEWLYLETGEDNRIAQKFYQALGYLKADTIENYYGNGSAAWVMIKRLISS